MADPFYSEMPGPLAIQFLNYLWDRVTEQISATSTSNLTIGVGTKNLTTQASKQFAIGMPVRITRTTDVTQWMDGQVSAYDVVTGDMSVLVASTSGAGTFANWTISLSGQGGPAGAIGDKGWSPVFAVVADGARRVMRVADWTGGQGAKPAAGAYVGAAGLTADIAQAVDIRGPQGDITAALQALRDEVIAAKNAAVQAATDADLSAQDAGQSAQAAGNAADAAAGSAQTANTKAGEAAASAQTAGTKRDEAVQAATDAGQAKTDAITARNDAQTARGDAVTAKGQAEAARDAAQNYAAALAGTSATALVPTAGAVVFVTQAGKAWALGQRLRAASDDGATFMEGPVTAYAGTNLTLGVDFFVGAAEHADWNIALVGGRGAQGGAGLVSRGPWAAATAYAVGDLATDDGSTWERVVAGTTPTNPAGDAVNWRVFARRGIDGSGSVVSVQGIAPDGGGDVTLPEATGAAAGLMPAADKGKLDGIAAGATANATDAQLRDRATHSGTQAIATVVGLQAALDGKLAAANLDTDGTLAANSDVKIASQKAVKTYVDQIIAAQDAMVFRGVVDCSANPNYPAGDRGHTYRVSVAGKIGGAAGINVEAGDLLLCLTDGTAAGTQAAVGASWSIIQTNLDGAVIGPAGATDGYFAAFDGASGKLLKARTPAQVKSDIGLGNVPNVDSQNASNLNSGTVNKARLPASLDATQIAALAEGSTGPAIAGGTLTVDCSQCNGATITLNANITTLNLTNVPLGAYALYLRFIGDGTVRTVAFGASVKWGTAGAPTMTGTLNKEDWISLITMNQGASWIGNAKLNL